MAIAGEGLCLNWKQLNGQAGNMDLQYAEEHTQIWPDSLEDLYILGLVYFRKYDHNKALAAFEKMLEIMPDSIEAKWGIAECLRRDYEIEQSQKMLEEVISRDPDFFPAYISLAYLKFNLKQYDISASLAYHVIRNGKKKADTHTFTRAYLIYAGAKGMISHYGGPVSKLINGMQVYPNLKQARALMPYSPEVYYGLGCYYMLAPSAYGGDLDKAQDLLEQAITGDENLIDAYVRLAQVYKMKGDIEKFNHYLNVALSKDPKNFLALDVKSNECDFICPDQEKTED